MAEPLTLIDAPEIIDVPARQAAVIRLVVPSERIMEEMGAGIREVFDVLAAQGIAPAGPWFTHHFKPPAEVFDYEICVPVAVAVAPSGRVKPGGLPAHRAARTVYRGGYEGLGAAWGEFDAWVKANGHSPAEELWESYEAGPESGPDPSQWRTQLNRPLRG